MDKMVGFYLNEQRYGLTVSSVNRVIPVVDITPVPNLPDSFLGIINVQGQIIPVFNLRKPLGLPYRAPVLSDKLIMTNTNSYSMAFLVDRITDLIDYDEADIDKMDGVFCDVMSPVKLPDGIVLLIQNPEHFLQSEDESMLQRAIDHD